MNTLRAFWGTYGKGVIALLIVVYTAVQAAISDGHITTVEGVQIVIAAATAVGVYLFPLHPTAPWLKTGLAVLLAILQVVASMVVSGWSWNELLLAVLTTLGVGLAPARSTVTPPSPVAAR